MLVTLQENLAAAEKGNLAVGAFNTPNLESVRAVISAAEELNVPIIISHAELHDSFMPLEIIGPVMLDAARRASVPVGVHLDHGLSYNLLVRAMKLGFTSVMYDGSALPYEENVENTRRIVQVAKALNVGVEAELGRILRPETGAPGTECEGLKPEDYYTDPEMAVKFVETTGIDALAVAFGTAHGLYKAQPKLDFDRLKTIRQKTRMPLVMHGGSGVSDADFRRAIACGVRKINYYTYMAYAGANAVKTEMLGSASELYYHDITMIAMKAMKQDSIKAMRVFSSNEK